MSPEVGYPTLTRIAGTLEAAAKALDDCAGSAPGSVDAGELTGLILVLLGTAMGSAGGLAEGLSVAGADALTSARNDAESDWHGEAGSAFAERMRSASTPTRDLQVGIVAVAREVEGYGHAVRIAQERMAGIRAAAMAGGLVVSGFAIEEPGAGPPDPGSPPIGPYADLVSIAHAEDAAAWTALIGGWRGRSGG